MNSLNRSIRIIPSARTWMRLLKNVFVVIEDTFEVRFAMRQCEITEYEKFTTFSCKNEPTYILSRECSAIYFGGDGPCCKVDDMFVYLTQMNTELYSHLKFVLHGDDDQFWRVDQIMRWLAAVDKAGLDEWPLVGQGALTPCGKGAYGIKKCHEMNTIGWYQPLFMNKAALERLKPTADQYGSKQQCNAFRMTHDVGLGPYFWMFNMIHISMPGFGHQIESKNFDDNRVIMHGIKHMERHDHCGTGEGWGDEFIYNQRMVIGCGDMGHPNPNREKSKSTNHYEAWEYYRHHGNDLTFGKAGSSDWIEVKAVVYPDEQQQQKEQGTGAEAGYGRKLRIKKIFDKEGIITVDGFDQKVKAADVQDKEEYGGEKLVKVVIPKMYPLWGYSETKHSKTHNIREKFEPYTIQDCTIGGPSGYGND